MKTRFYSGISSACLALATTTMAQATDLVTQKLTGRWSAVPTSYQFGASLAINDKWIVAGSSLASEQASVQGAVQVYNAVTGAWVRKLLPPGTPVMNSQFGYSCALSGNTLLVGQLGSLTENPGAAHLFDLSTGKLMKSFKAPGVDDHPNNRFGWSVALAATRLVVGAPGVDGLSGAAFVFDLKTGASLAKLQPPGLEASSSFGASVASEGNVLIVGAPGVDSSRGAAYAYDLTTLTLIKEIQPEASVAGNSVGYPVAIHQGKVVLAATGADSIAGKIFIVNLADWTERTLTASDSSGIAGLGYSIAVDQGLLIAGAPFHQGFAGAAYLFDLNSSSTTEFQKLVAGEMQSNFAQAVALHGHTALLAAPFDDMQAEDGGAVYVTRPLTRPMPLTRVAAKADYAPDAPEINFNTIGEAFINPDGEIAFTSTLAGAGSNAGKDNGWFSTLWQSPWMDMVLKTRSVHSGLIIGALSRPLINHPSFGFAQATLTGTGVPSSNNQAIYRMDNLGNVALAVRKGVPFTHLREQQILTFHQTVQSRGFDQLALTYTSKMGVGGATAGTDSGLLIHSGAIAVAAFEGDPAPGTTVSLGQFGTRLAGYYSHVTYPTALTGGPKTNQALYQKVGANLEVLVARKGGAATGADAPLSAFIGESSDSLDTVLYKATLSTPATPANNEGLWTRNVGGVTSLVLRKGDAVPGLTGIKIAKFINYWHVMTQTMALVQLTGKGVAAANDQALLLHQSFPPYTGMVTVLMREGDPAPGCLPATIGVISRVEVEPRYGHYLVLATLTGAPAGTDLALFRGFSAKLAATVDEQILRRPSVVLRKGQWFSNQPSKLKSILLPASHLTASGAGNVGLGSAIQEPVDPGTPTPIVINVEFDNGVRQLVTGTP